MKTSPAMVAMVLSMELATNACPALTMIYVKSAKGKAFIDITNCSSTENRPGQTLGLEVSWDNVGTKRKRG